MPEIKLFHIEEGVKELKSQSVTVERELQNIIEKNMFAFFGVHFLQSEYRIDNGRMDSIGIDENYCPVIFEYKRQINENIINQGLFYLNWLTEHKANFKLLVMEKRGKDEAEKIDWSMPRVICIANNFNKYDIEAVKQMQKNISLIRYKKYSDNLLLFELLNHIKSNFLETKSETEAKKENESNFLRQYKNAPLEMKNIFDELKEFILALGDDISENVCKNYIAFKKIQNFVTLEIHQKKVTITFKLNPDNYSLNEKLRDVRNIGHWGCDLQYYLQSTQDISMVKELIQQAYLQN